MMISGRSWDNPGQTPDPSPRTAAAASPTTRPSPTMTPRQAIPPPRWTVQALLGWLPADLPLLEFDAVLMERVFCNLIENAAKYTPPGSLIEIGARREAEQMLISVSDNGPGLPPGKEAGLFEKFTRGQDESAIPGVGLGLAIVRAIVDAHKGKVWAENRSDGPGARFVFALPLGQPPALPTELL